MEKQSEEMTRIDKAQTYFDQHLEGQLDWYDRKATKYKQWHKQLGFVILAAGALSSIVPLWKPEPDLHWTSILISILGITIVIAKGIERIWSFDENWSAYRQAAEAMKREQRLYINNAAVYSDSDDEAAAYRLFVERVEDIIAAEQHSFWQNNRGEKKPSLDE